MKLLKEITRLQSGAVHASIHSDDSQIGGNVPVISDPMPTPDYFPDNLEEKVQYRVDEDLHNSLIDHYNKFDKADKADIKAYTNGSRRINGNLWNRFHGKTTEQHSRIGGLDLALKKHGAPKAFTVYSGTRHDPRDHMNSEGIVHHPAYLSTSLSAFSAKGFAINHIKAPSPGEYPTRHVLKINIPKGHPGAYIDHISAAKGEREFILPRGLNLKHNKTTISTEPHCVFGKIKTATHHMEIVGQEPEARYK